jgi:hypothetical protein
LRLGNPRHDHERPPAEIETAQGIWRLGFGRLSLHDRIIPGREQPEQEFLTGRGFFGRQPV